MKFLHWWDCVLCRLFGHVMYVWITPGYESYCLRCGIRLPDSATKLGGEK